MRHHPALLALAVALSACGPLTNEGQVYPPVSGAMDVRWKLATEGIAKVEFTLDGQAVGTDETPEDGFAIALDSTKYPDGLHVLKLIATAADGGIGQVVEHTLLFKNTAPATP